LTKDLAEFIKELERDSDNMKHIQHYDHLLVMYHFTKYALKLSKIADLVVNEYEKTKTIKPETVRFLKSVLENGV
jgi:GH35 family endo-1,4-beta-xylanase